MILQQEEIDGLRAEADHAEKTGAHGGFVLLTPMFTRRIMDGIEAAKITGCTSDGYHTFDELYEHRATLWISLCRLVAAGADTPVWRSDAHSDGSLLEGWFLLGIHDVPGIQMTYHLPMSRWDECPFAKTLVIAPEFDGHTPGDVLERIARLI